MTAALLDRRTPRGHLFEMPGDSYRFKESMKGKQDKDAKKTKGPVLRPAGWFPS